MKNRLLLLFAGAVLMILLVPCNLPSEVEVNCASKPQVADAKMRWYDGSTLVYVPAGKFLMGINGGQDNPLHEVLLDDFWFYKTEVSNGMYSLCVADGGCTPPGPEVILPDYTDPALKDHPVVGVTWAQANTYCKWMEARLPTEAEWEKSARGPDGRTYPWGQALPDCDRLNFNNCVGQLTNVIEYPNSASPYGAFDLSGNAFEWVSDWYKAAYYNESPAKNPLGPESGETRSLRGGSFASTADQVLPSTRAYADPLKFRADLGFRCVVVDAQCFASPCEVNSTITRLSRTKTEPTSEPSCDPPPLNVSVVPYCQNKLPYANVDPNGAKITFPDGQDCNPAGDIYVCTGSEEASFEIKACTTCMPPTLVAPVPETPSCPPGYKFDAAACTCKFTGLVGRPGTQCPSTLFSMLYNSEQQCCQSQPTRINLSRTPLFVEPGFAPFDCKGSGKLPPPELVTKCKPVKVTLPVCSQPTGDGCPEKQCDPPNSWDPSKCCCALRGKCK